MTRDDVAVKIRRLRAEARRAWRWMANIGNNQEMIGRLRAHAQELDSQADALEATLTTAVAPHSVSYNQQQQQQQADTTQEVEPKGDKDGSANK